MNKRKSSGACTARPEQMSIVKTLAEKPEKNVALVVGAVEIYIPLEGMVDLAKDGHGSKSSYQEAVSQIARLEKMLNSPLRGERLPLQW